MEKETVQLLIKIGITFGTITVLYIIAFYFRKLINKKVEDLFRRHNLRKITYYTATIVSIAFALIYWIENVAALGAIFGGLGAAIAVALHKPILKIFAWMIIVIRKIYTVGDRIEVDKLKGDIIDIRLYHTLVLEIGDRDDGEQSTGRVVYIPNDKVLNTDVYNYTFGFKYVWNEMSVSVTFESNYKKAVNILNEILSSDELKVSKPARVEIDRMTKKHVIHYKTLTPFVWVKIVDFGVKLTLRYLINVRKRRITEQFISKQILERFNAEDDVEFAYPTYRIYKRGEEKTD